MVGVVVDDDVAAGELLLEPELEAAFGALEGGHGLAHALGADLAGEHDGGDGGYGVFDIYLDGHAELDIPDEQSVRADEVEDYRTVAAADVGGVEIASAAADGPQSVITQQVESGVAVRMALLYMLTRREG